MTLNGVIALILRYFTEFDGFGGRLSLRHSAWRQTYNVRRISSSTFGRNWSTTQRGLSAIAELLVMLSPERLSESFTFKYHKVFFDHLWSRRDLKI